MKRLEAESRLAGYKYRSDIIVGISQVLLWTSGWFLIGLRMRPDCWLSGHVSGHADCSSKTSLSLFNEAPLNVYKASIEQYQSQSCLDSCVPKMRPYCTLNWLIYCFALYFIILFVLWNNLAEIPTNLSQNRTGTHNELLYYCLYRYKHADNTDAPWLTSPHSWNNQDKQII